MGVENPSDEGLVNDLSLCTGLHRTLRSNTHLILNLVQVKLFTRPAVHVGARNSRQERAVPRASPRGCRERARRWRASGGSAPRRHGQGAPLLFLLPSAPDQTCAPYVGNLGLLHNLWSRWGFFGLSGINSMTSSWSSFLVYLLKEESMSHLESLKHSWNYASQTLENVRTITTFPLVPLEEHEIWSPLV